MRPETDRLARRHRLLSARLVGDDVLAMAVFSRESDEAVMRLLVEGLMRDTNPRHQPPGSSNAKGVCPTYGDQTRPAAKCTSKSSGKIVNAPRGSSRC